MYEEILKEAQTILEVKEATYEGGEVKVYYKDVPFPFKGANSPEALWSINIVKKTVVEFLKILSLSQFWPSIVLLALSPTKSLTKLLQSFTRITNGVMTPYFNYKFFNQGELQLLPISRGIGQFTEVFFTFMRVPYELGHQVSKLIAHIVEYDAFYRFKLLDILSETNQYRLSTFPRQEVQRLLQICYDREEVLTTYIRPKLKILMKIFDILLRVPTIKKAFVNAIGMTKFDLFKIDEADLYWMLWRNDYHYFGFSLEERLKIMEQKGWKPPSPTKVV